MSETATHGVDGHLYALAWCSSGWHRKRLTRWGAWRALQRHTCALDVMREADRPRLPVEPPTPTARTRRTYAYVAVGVVLGALVGILVGGLL